VQKLSCILKNSFPVGFKLFELPCLDGGPHISEKGLIKMEVMEGVESHGKDLPRQEEVT